MGTKSGELILYDIAASAIMATYKAHTGAVWGIHVRPDGRGLVSGSADKDVKFWDFEMKEQDAGERIQNRLGQETIVSPFSPISTLQPQRAKDRTDVESDQEHPTHFGPRQDAQDDRRRTGSQVQSRWPIPRCRTTRFNSQDLFPGYLEVLPIALRS